MSDNEATVSIALAISGAVAAVGCAWAFMWGIAVMEHGWRKK